MNILFLDSVHPILEERLIAERGWNCIHDYKTSKEDLNMKGVNGLVIRSRFTIDDTFLSKSPDLKFIARSGSGLENIDLEACANRNVIVYNSPEGNSTAVAEHAIGMLLMFANNLRRADAEVRNREWNREKNRGFEIEGKTVAIIGYGVMGSAFAKRLKGFGCRVIAFDKYKKNFGNEGVEEVSMEEVFDQADIVSLHVPLKEDTHYLVDESWLSSFKKSIVLMNTSRGPVVKIAAVIAAISDGTLKGACLDVIEYEEKSFENIGLNHSEFKVLSEFDNVLFSPHVAGWTVESYVKLSSFLADKILRDF
ncbi:MAG: NAD(P)-dependent oxidoreductase [Flavobacteriales bacterium]